MTTIVDYGLGNVGAFVNVFHRLDIPVRVATSANELKDAERVILPGVGHFDHAMERLELSGMRDTLDELVVGGRLPVLGVCVGMQLLGRSSQEGAREGLGWIAGHVERLPRTHDANPLPLPHMGWNDVEPTRQDPLFRHLSEEPRFYFLHSYAFRCDDHNDVLATTSYGEGFCCAVRSANVYGVQFHPEKSHQDGTALLRGFAEISRA